MKKIIVLHGPNLNLLGKREPDTYGSVDLSEINETLKLKAKKQGVELTCIQSNSESQLVTCIHEAYNQNTADYIIFNPAAFTHTSIALRDAFLATKIPFVEVHLSNIFARESFRHHSYFSDIAEGIISGFGAKGYLLALQYIIEKH